MSEVQIKSFVLQGNLSTSYLNYEFANNETINGLWQMCIKDIAYSAVEDLNSIVRLSCNLVKDLRVENYRKETYNPVIATFLLKAKPTEKKIFQFEPFWFQINCANSELKLHFMDAESNLEISKDCKIFLTVLLKQIK